MTVHHLNPSPNRIMKYKNYFVELLITVGEYEIYSKYMILALNESEAKKHLELGYSDARRRHTKLNSLVEVSDGDAAVLRRFI